jgi:hypothetical protein
MKANTRQRLLSPADAGLSSPLPLEREVTMNAIETIIVENLEVRRFLSAGAVEGLEPKLDPSVNQINIGEMVARIQGAWTGLIIDKQGVIATLHISVKSVEHNGAFSAMVELKTPKDEALVYEAQGIYNPFRNRFTLGWDLGKKNFGRISGAVDPDTAVMTATLDYAVQGARRWRTEVTTRRRGPSTSPGTGINPGSGRSRRRWKPAAPARSSAHWR